MNNFSALDSRNRRNLLAHSMNAFSPPFYKNYSTDTSDMKTSFGDSLFINTVHLIPEPMKMNLADSVVTLNEKKLKTNMAAETKVNNNFNMKKPQNAKNDYYPSLAGITNFFSGVLNVMGAMFQKRANSPVQYYDCFEQGFEDHHQMTPSSLAWQNAKHEDQNINGRAQTDEFANETYTEFSSDMSSNDFRSITAHCEDKLNRVRLLLNTPQVQKTARPRRPKRAFHEAGSVEELFEDAFNPEDFIALANETFLEYCSPYNHHHEDLHMVDAPKVKTNKMPVKESMEIVQNISLNESGELKKDTPVDKIENSVDNNARTRVISSCEDKVSRLKALLQSRRAQKANLNETKSSPPTSDVAAPVSSPVSIPKPLDSHRQAEVIFASQVELPLTPDSPCQCALDPSSYFDEVTGRFCSSSATDSEDSFQIVFTDSPKDRRKRLPSDCESEDSFIVFEESPDSCYTSNDVFGDDTNDATNMSDSEDSDSDCESDLDSGLSTIALSHSLTRTFGDLTDGSLYEESKSEDVVDCAFRSGVEIPGELIDAEKVKQVESQDHSEPTKRGLLLDDARKRERKKLPEKKVHWSPLPPKVHVMRVWAFAARQARAGHWERHALDRERFKRRIADVEMAISWVLKPQHRSRVMFQRFMPWWNAQRRKELAEKKQRELEERLKREKEEAEKLALENDKETSRGNDSSDANAVEQNHAATKLGDKEELGGVLENTQENTEVKVESSGNEIVNNINCNINRLTNSGSIVKLDNTAGESTQAVESTVNKTSICDEMRTMSDSEMVANRPRDGKLCNGVDVYCRIDSASEDCVTGRSQIVNEKSIGDQLPVRNTDSDRDHVVKDNNMKVTKDGVTLKSSTSKGACVARDRAS